MTATTTYTKKLTVPRLGDGWVVCLADLGGMSYGVGGAGGDAWTRSAVLADPASGANEMFAGLTSRTPVRDLADTRTQAVATAFRQELIA